MTQEFENMLYLFGCGALGRKVDASRCVDIRKIRNLAIAQNIWPIVYGAIRPLIISGEVKIPPEIISMLENANISNVAINIQKVEFTQEILKKLSAAGFEICLLKGTTLARHYYQPQERISGDTDILISPEDEISFRFP